MTPPRQGGLSATAQVVSNVFSSCILSLHDLQPAEKITVGHKAIQDIICLISSEAAAPQCARTALTETSTLAQTAISRLSQDPA